MANGEFDNLEGHGKPLDLDDNSQVPEEMRAAYRAQSTAASSRAMEKPALSLAAVHHFRDVESGSHTVTIWKDGVPERETRRVTVEGNKTTRMEVEVPW